MGNYDLITFFSVCSPAHKRVRSIWGMSQAENIFHHTLPILGIVKRAAVREVRSKTFSQWILQRFLTFPKILFLLIYWKHLEKQIFKSHLKVLHPQPPTAATISSKEIQEHQRWNDLNWNEDFLWQVFIYKCKLCLKMCFYVSAELGEDENFLDSCVKASRWFSLGTTGVRTGKIDEIFLFGERKLVKLQLDPA